MSKLFRLSLMFCCLWLCELSAYNPKQDKWEKTDFIWNFGIITSCDIGLGASPIKFFQQGVNFDKDLYKQIKSGDIVWLRCCFVQQFSELVLPEIKNPFVLVISHGVDSFPSECDRQKKGFDIENFICNEKIIHIFAQNCDYKGPSDKVSHLPIGMDFHTVAYKGGGWGEVGSPIEQEIHLKKLLGTLQPTALRRKKAFVDFQLSDTMHAETKRYLQFGEDRTSIFKRLLPTGLIDYSGFMHRFKLWTTKGQYAFSISPWGNGLDCHRTWEDLVLGCIVIVKTSPLDPLYEGLPVVIVQDWNEITEKNLSQWLDQYKDAFVNPSYREKLTNKYWFNKIQEVARPYKR